MTKSIYDRFDSAIKSVSAYAIFQGANYVGRIVIKYPKDGAGRLTAFVQEWGFTMVSGTASGFGYDKTGAALASAHSNAKKEFNGDLPPLFVALSEVTYDGQWRSALESKGFTVHNVI